MVFGIRWPVLLAGAGLLLAAGCALILIPQVPSRAEAASQPGVLEIISFGSLQGDLTPCGCRVPRGGLGRRAQVIKSLQEAGTPYLHLELGDFTKEDEASGAFVTEFLWDTFRKMDVTAVGIGPKELHAWPLFQKLLMRKDLPVISSNVFLQTSGGREPIGRVHGVFEAGGHKIGILCLMGKQEFEEIDPPEGVSFVFEDPVEAAQRLIPELDRQADLIVLMSQMSPERTDRFLREVDGIDVALYGQWAEWEQHAVQVGKTIVNQTGMKGQYLGRLILSLDAAGAIKSFQSRNAALDSTFPTDPVIGKLTDEAEAKADELIREYRQKRQAEFERQFLGG